MTRQRWLGYSRQAGVVPACLRFVSLSLHSRTRPGQKFGKFLDAFGWLHLIMRSSCNKCNSQGSFRSVMSASQGMQMLRCGAICKRPSSGKRSLDHDGFVSLLSRSTLTLTGCRQCWMLSLAAWIGQLGIFRGTEPRFSCGIQADQNSVKRLAQKLYLGKTCSLRSTSHMSR